MSLDANIRVLRGSFTLDLELTIEPGEIAVAVGPNASGKSTLASALAGLLPVESGSIRLNGRSLDNGRTRTPACDRRIGMMFQDLLLFEHMTALDNAAFGPRNAGASRSEARKRARDWLDRLGVGEQANTKPHKLSGGQAQRVALARALATEPDLLILDEPLSALDLQSRPAIRRLLAEILSEFRGVKLVITHDPLEAMALGDRLLILDSGRLVQEGTPDEIRRRPRVEYAASLVGVNLLRGSVIVENGRTFIDLEQGGRLSVPADSLEPGSAVFATLHPHAIILSNECPGRTSVRNTLPGRILGADTLGDRVRVHVGSIPPLTAEITPNAAAELHLKPGARVWASFKATEIGVYPR